MKSLILKKLRAQHENVALFEDSLANGASRRNLQRCSIRSTAGESTSDVLLIEAVAAQQYFRLWRDLPIRWAPKSEKRIASEWLTYDQRPSKVSGENRNASHPLNAILNYGYAVLESRVRIACAAFGLDPNTSYLHANKRGRSNLVFDLIEPLRPALDRVTIRFIQNNRFESADFQTSISGACTLNPQMAKRIGVSSSFDPEVQASVAKFRDSLLSADCR